MDDRIYQKKIYIGNLSATITSEELADNLKKVYQKELSNDGPVAEIQGYHNTAAYDRQTKLQRSDMTREIRKSVCAVLTSHPEGRYRKSD